MNQVPVVEQVAEFLNEPLDRQGWAALSEPSLWRIWNNEQDAAYDDWRELYGIPAR